MAQASPFPTEPQLRLDPGGHTAMIRRTAVDAAGRWLVSGSEDKTVRVWRLPQPGEAQGPLVLEQTLRVPLGPGNLGKVYAVALTPDGGTVAVGGYTGYADRGGHLIYLFDRATGALTQRLGGLPTAVFHLAFDAEGRQLAAVLYRGGLRLYGLTDPGWAEAALDPDYGDDSYWAEFAPDGGLATTCWDGQVRLYDRPGSAKRSFLGRIKATLGWAQGGLHPSRAAKAPSGARPFACAFSPDGSLLAVGYEDGTAVDLLDGRTLAHLGSADTGGMDNGNLFSIAWSADGQTLFAGGRYADGDWRPAFSWSQAGLGPRGRPLEAATNTVMTLHPLPGGGLVVGAQDGLWVLGPAGPDGDRETMGSTPLVAADLRGQVHDRGIRVSATGDRIAFGFELWGKGQALFDLGALALDLDPAPKSLADLALPDEGSAKGGQAGPGWAVTDWVNSRAPKLSGRPIPLHPYEIARSLALTPPPGTPGFCLGAEWSLRALTQAGQALWRRPVPGIVWALNCTRDGRFAVAGCGDGTLRWHRLTDGAECLALYPHPDRRRWVLWTPLGHYVASAGGEDLIGWHQNRGPEGDQAQAPDFYHASRLRGAFNRPDVIARVLKTGDPLEALRLADAARGSPPLPAPDPAALLPPLVRIKSPQPGVGLDGRRLALFYQAESGTGPIDRVEARVDGARVDLLEDARLSVSPDGGKLVGQITLTIPPQDCLVTLIAWNAHGASEAASLPVTWTGPVDHYKPRLYALAVGVAAYSEGVATPLRFAARDADSLAAELEGQAGGLYREVDVRPLTDAAASRKAILDGLHWLEREVGQRDVAVVFLSGHGLRDAFGAYYFLSADTDPTCPHHSAVKGLDLIDYLRRIAGKRVLLIDTCYSGALGDLGSKGPTDTLPEVDRFANELADAENGVVVFSSSTGRQLSLEDEAWGHGAFTCALLEAIRDGRADFRGQGYVTLAELEAYLADRVKEMTQGRQHPTVAKPTAVDNYRMFKVRAA